MSKANGRSVIWSELEDEVRQLASYLWNAPAISDSINGVRCDCIVKVDEDQWKIVEITKSETLEKLRTDLAKFATVRPYLHSQNIYAKCYFVTANKPSDGLRESGRGQHVEVMSLDEFRTLFFDFPKYAYVRNAKQFGSAVDPVSGEKDPRNYIPIRYQSVTHGATQYSVVEIAKKIQAGQRIILLGEFGTGKSRCLQQIFEYLSSSSGAMGFPLSMDLRDHWGMRTAQEMLRRHLADLGLNSYSENLIRVFEKAKLCLLLDGFDEIGSQSWSDNSATLRSLRAKALVAIKDLLSKTRHGAIISGREHYFNGNKEMFDALGLQEQSTEVIQCPAEFNGSELRQYMPNALNIDAWPAWLPKRPLICQLVAGLDPQVANSAFSENNGEGGLWDALMDAICVRDARIGKVLDAGTIKQVLMRIARCTRTKASEVGPVTITEMNRAFEDVVGTPPVDESAVMLQRLPALGRVSAETSDRQFVDVFILDGLLAADVVACTQTRNDEAARENWHNAIGQVGQSVVASDIRASKGLKTYLAYCRLAANQGNAVLAGDILSSILRSGEACVDFGQLFISYPRIRLLDFSECIPSNLTISHGIIDALYLSDDAVDKVSLNKCAIGEIHGVSEARGIPTWLVDCTVDVYDAVNTVTRIKQAALNPRHLILVTIIKKSFFQPGKGRMEAALIRGLGQIANPRITTKILKILQRDGILGTFKGREGIVYTPQREYADRMRQMLSELKSSTDPLWHEVSLLD